MSAPVMADAQFGVQAILRPFDGFEAVYGAGVPGDTPILFLEGGGSSLDPEAGRPGYSPKLLRGVPVAYGSRLQIVLPSALNSVESGYTWQILWRLRGPGDAQRSDGRLGWHFPKTANGRPETIAAQRFDRILIPVLSETILYTPAEPAGDGTATCNLRFNATSPKAEYLPTPLTPVPGEALAVSGYYQQGVFDPGSMTFPALAPQPSFSSYFTNAKGDEMLLSLYRDRARNWDFATTDAIVSAMFGSGSPSDLGVYLCQGSAP